MSQTLWTSETTHTTLAILLSTNAGTSLPLSTNAGTSLLPPTNSNLVILPLLLNEISKDVSCLYKKKPCRNAETFLSYNVDSCSEQRPSSFVKLILEICRFGCLIPSLNFSLWLLLSRYTIAEINKLSCCYRFEKILWLMNIPTACC